MWNIFKLKDLKAKPLDMDTLYQNSSSGLSWEHSELTIGILEIDFDYLFFKRDFRDYFVLFCFFLILRFSHILIHLQTQNVGKKWILKIITVYFGVRNFLEK